MRKEKIEMLKTGLKAIDILAPIPKNRDTLLVGTPGTGSSLMIEELAIRLSKFANQKVLVLLDQYHQDLGGEELISSIEKRFAGDSDRPVQLQIIDGETLKLTLSNAGIKSPLSSDTVIIICSNLEGRIQHIRRAIDAIRNNSKGSNPRSLTTIVVSGEVVFGDYDSQIFLNRKLAALGIYPAIDPRRSKALNKSLTLEARHESILAKLRPLLVELYEEYDADMGSSERDSFESSADNLIGLQASKYLSQPQVVAESFTDLKSKFVDYDETLKVFEEILAGRHTEKPHYLFYLLNDWQDVKEKLAKTQ
jgi:F0F1-type ATP synthase beta subunit